MKGVEGMSGGGEEKNGTRRKIKRLRSLGSQTVADPFYSDRGEGEARKWKKKVYPDGEVTAIRSNYGAGIRVTCPTVLFGGAQCQARRLRGQDSSVS